MVRKHFNFSSTRYDTVDMWCLNTYQSKNTHMHFLFNFMPIDLVKCYYYYVALTPISGTHLPRCFELQLNLFCGLSVSDFIMYLITN